MEAVLETALFSPLSSQRMSKSGLQKPNLCPKTSVRVALKREGLFSFFFFLFDRQGGPDWARLKLGTGSSTQVSHVSDRDPTT